MTVSTGKVVDGSIGPERRFTGPKRPETSAKSGLPWASDQQETNRSYPANRRFSAPRTTLLKIVVSPVRVRVSPFSRAAVACRAVPGIAARLDAGHFSASAKRIRAEHRRPTPERRPHGQFRPSDGRSHPQPSRRPPPLAISRSGRSSTCRVSTYSGPAARRRSGPVPMSNGAGTNGTRGSSGERTMRVGVVSTYPPRPCGIGTFSRDLREALLGADGVSAVDLVAIVREDEASSRRRRS